MGFGQSGTVVQENKYRVFILAILIFIVFVIYLIKLFNIQVINSFQYQNKANITSSRSEKIDAQRGRIYGSDSNIPLATNIDSFTLMVTPAELGEIEPITLLQRLDNNLIDGLDVEKVFERFPTYWANSYVNIEIKEGVTYEELTRISENIELYPGLKWEPRPYRYYNQADSISHILGYVGNISTEQLYVLYNEGYDQNSILGKSGIEKVYDSYLRGIDGLRTKRVDVKGRSLEDQYHIEPPINGYDIYISIDASLQRLAEKALGERKGAVVVLKPETGEILAMVSYPSYNPNLFASNGSQGYKELSLDPNNPFLNRAIQSAYAPASSFKVLMSIIIAEENIVPLNHQVLCTGEMVLGDRVFKCHKESGHGYVDLESALAESCNIYFGTIGMDIGIETISEYANSMGLGEFTEIDLLGEISGIMPDPDWKKNTYNNAWTGGDTLNVSVGQGFSSFTPLQMANMVAMIVNDGVNYKPRILSSIVDPQTGRIVEEIEKEELHRFDLQDSTWETVRNAMSSVSEEGTANVVTRFLSIPIAGKTGTGEVGLEEKFHSWFISYGPYDNFNQNDDKIVVVAMVEAYNETWDWWAPKTAGVIYEGYFNDTSYEETIRDMRERGVWFAYEMPLPEDLKADDREVVE